MKPLDKISSYFKRYAQSLADELVDSIVQEFDFEVPKEEIQNAKKTYESFMKFIGESIVSETEKMPDGLLDWSKENGERQAKNGGRISDIVMRYPDSRQVFIDKVTSIGKEFDLGMDEVVLLIKKVNLILDISINETVFAFERFSGLLLEKAQDEVNELTAPVVPIQDGIAVLPLIGSIDYDRAKLIMEKVVPEIKKLQIECLIMDFSGIVNIDAQIAKYVFDIRSVLRLVGVNTIASGVRPDLAQQAVTEGIDLTSVPTFANVKQAIESLEEE